MLVVFVFDGDHDRVREVIWQKAENLVVSRIWRSDGSIVEKAKVADTLIGAIDATGLYSSTYPAEVDDIRSAFKYLGKAADLVETLPEVDLSYGTKYNRPAS